MKNKLKLQFKLSFLIIPVFFSVFTAYSSENSNISSPELSLNRVEIEQFETIVKFKSTLTNDELKLTLIHFNQLANTKHVYFDEKSNSFHIIYDASNKESMINEINSFFASKKMNIESMTSIKYDNKI